MIGKVLLDLAFSDLNEPSVHHVIIHLVGTECQKSVNFSKWLLSCLVVWAVWLVVGDPVSTYVWGGKQTELYTVLTCVSWVTQDSDRKIITGVQLNYDSSSVPLDVEFLREAGVMWLVKLWALTLQCKSEGLYAQGSHLGERVG